MTTLEATNAENLTVADSFTANIKTHIVNTSGSWSPVVWPYPQAKFPSYYTLAFALADADDVEAGVPAEDDSVVLYELLVNNNAWTATAICDMGESSEITQLDVSDFGSFYSVSAYGRDDSDLPVIKTILRAPGDVSPAYTLAPTNKVPPHICCCNFKGQAIIGGVDSTDPHWCDLGLAGVHWSRIGSYDFRPDVNRTAGYMKMPWIRNDSGIVYRVERLGNQVMVYGDGGRAVLLPKNEPAVTFGLKEVPGFGIASGNHMAGDEHVHCFIDTEKDLWVVKRIEDYRGFEFIKLGYREYMEALLDYTHATDDYRTIMSYEPRAGRFYISNGNRCFVLNKTGLYETDQLPTSVGNHGGSILCGFFIDSNDPRIVMTTGTLDMGRRDKKSVELIETAANYYKTSNSVTQPLYGSIYHRNDHRSGADTFDQTPWIRLNRKGVFTKKRTATEFRISIKADTYDGAEFDFDYMKVAVKYVDKMSVRGVMNVSSTDE